MVDVRLGQTVEARSCGDVAHCDAEPVTAEEPAACVEYPLPMTQIAGDRFGAHVRFAQRQRLERLLVATQCQRIASPEPEMPGEPEVGSKVATVRVPPQ